MAIYNRYLTKEDLYADNSIGFKNIYTFQNRQAIPIEMFGFLLLEVEVYLVIMIILNIILQLIH